MWPSCITVLHRAWRGNSVYKFTSLCLLLQINFTERLEDKPVAPRSKILCTFQLLFIVLSSNQTCSLDKLIRLHTHTHTHTHTQTHTNRDFFPAFKCRGTLDFKIPPKNFPKTERALISVSTFRTWYWKEDCVRSLILYLPKLCPHTLSAAYCKIFKIKKKTYFVCIK